MWKTIQCLTDDHESCLGRNCSTEQTQVCMCSCHQGQKVLFEQARRKRQTAGTARRRAVMSRYDRFKEQIRVTLEAFAPPRKE